MKFKKGDIVVIKHANPILKGKIGVIKDVSNRWGQPYSVESVDADNTVIDEYNPWYFESELSYHRISDTKIARKLNKDVILKAEDGWLYLKR